MNGQHYSEYSLVLELDKTVDMKEITLGFNSVWTDFNDKVLGIPSAVLLEGGLHPTDFTPLGSLQPLNDEGYSNVAVKVFVKNFNTIRSHQETELQSQTSPNSDQSNEFETAFKSLSHRPVKFLKLRFRRPVVTFIEGQSLLSGSMYKNVAVSVSFLSVVGHDLSKQSPGLFFWQQR